MACRPVHQQPAIAGAVIAGCLVASVQMHELDQHEAGGVHDTGQKPPQNADRPARAQQPIEPGGQRRRTAASPAAWRASMLRYSAGVRVM